MSFNKSCIQRQESLSRVGHRADISSTNAVSPKFLQKMRSIFIFTLASLFAFITTVHSRRLIACAELYLPGATAIACNWPGHFKLCCAFLRSRQYYLECLYGRIVRRTCPGPLVCQMVTIYDGATCQITDTGDRCVHDEA